MYIDWRHIKHSNDKYESGEVEPEFLICHYYLWKEVVCKYLNQHFKTLFFSNYIWRCVFFQHPAIPANPITAFLPTFATLTLS